MVPFSKSSVCVCHSTASFMVHSLSFLSPSCDLSLTGPPPSNMFSMCFCLCSLCILLLFICLMGFPYLCVRSTSSNLWFYLQLLQTAPQLKIDGSSIERVISNLWKPSPKTSFFSLNTGPEILRLNAANLNEMDEWSLFPVSNVCFFPFNYKVLVHCVNIQKLSVAIISTFYNVMSISFSPKLML